MYLIMQGPCKVSALGRIGSIGEFYDVKTDRLCGSNIFATFLDQSSVKSIDSHYTDLSYIQGDSFNDKCHHLDVHAELKLSVLAGLLQLGGSGKYLNDKKETSRTSSCTLIYNIKTVLEKINIFDQSLKPFFSLDALKLASASGATHIVTEIQWGANSMVTFESKIENSSEVTQVEGKLEVELFKFKIGLSGLGEVNYKDTNISNVHNLSFKVFGDILSNDKLPQNFEEALDYLKDVPSKARAANNGKGTPLAYILFPISMIQMYLQLEVQQQKLVQSINESTIGNFVQLFESIAKIKQQLQSLKEDIKEYEYVIPIENKTNVNDLYHQIINYESNTKAQLKEMIIQVRKCAKETNELEKLYVNFIANSNSPDKISTKIDELIRSITESTSFAKLMLNEGVNFLSETDSLENVILAAKEDLNIYVLSINRKNIGSLSTTTASANDQENAAAVWNINRRLFIALSRNSRKQRLNDIFYIYDTSSVTDLSISVGISHYKNGKCLTNNYAKSSTKMNLQCLAKSEQIIAGKFKPTKRVMVEIPCPNFYNEGTCKSGEHLWQCNRCKSNLEYGFDKYFYCDCGKALATSYIYKCDDIENHGFGFEIFNIPLLETFLNNFRPLKEKNILILGETGVGKSTWINGFVNYLTYSSLDVAARSESVALIPSTFTMTDTNGESINICTKSTIRSTKTTTSTNAGIGATNDDNYDDGNECQEAGASATQYPRSYVFPRNNMLIRIIDTPGIGDVRGIEQDKKNFEHIMNHISHLDEIHGICILLKPNNARLNVVFTFCIQELLTHLHKDAAKNIVFCFTNARSTFYRPGDTKPALDKLLAENKKRVEISLSNHTMYCVDNESVRFLAAIKNGIKFTDEETRIYSSSWIQSVKESMRLLEHIDGLQPHSTKSTITLNHARSLILALTEPIGEIAKNIEDNIAAVEEHEKLLQKSNNQKDDYEKDLYIPGIELVEEEIGYPMTVCAESKCSKSHTNPNGTRTVEYVQHCHEHCYLSVPTRTYPQPGLQQCSAMNKSTMNCRICGCSWSSHLHITYKLKRVNIKVKDYAVDQLLNETTSRMEKVRIIMNQGRKRIEELKKERNVIAEVSSKFAAFLKANAITPYNDALINYLEHLIKLEEAKITKGCDDRGLKGLEDMKRTYQQQVDILDKALEANNTAQILAPHEIEPEVQRLYKLPNQGATLKRLVQIVNSAANKNVAYNEHIYMPKNGQSGGGSFTNKMGGNVQHGNQLAVYNPKPTKKPWWKFL